MYGLGGAYSTLTQLHRVWPESRLTSDTGIHRYSQRCAYTVDYVIHVSSYKSAVRHQLYVLTL